MTDTIDLPCRYYRVYTDEDVPCREEHFQFVDRSLPLPPAQTALVLVDVWATHYVDSWLARAAHITRTRIVPLMAAARAAGVLVVHAPSPFIVERHHAESMPRRPAPPASDTWPPAGFRSIYRAGEFAAFGRNPEPRLSAALARYETELMINPEAAPQPEDEVIADGEQLHELLRRRGIVHLVYAGFATNWCVIGRDYGVIAMNGRGYDIVLVRDATDGIEFHDTVEDTGGQGTATRMAIREIETKYGWSTTTDDFVRAARQAAAPG